MGKENNDMKNRVLSFMSYVNKQFLTLLAGPQQITFFIAASFALVLFFCSYALATVPDEISQTDKNNYKKVLNPNKRYRENELLIKFKKNVVAASKASLHGRHGSEKIKEFRSYGIHHVKIGKGMSVEDAVKLYKADPDVEYAEPNYMYEALSLPNDPQYSQLWGMDKINAPAAWGLTTGNTNVVVAVIDTGIDYTHPDLAGNVWVNTGEIAGNGLDEDGNVYADDIYGIDVYNHDSNPMDDHGHGTHVAGTIGAIGNNGTGIVGVNWNVKILACKFIGSGGYGYTSGAIECLEYIKALKDKGVNIVATNNSWGCKDCYSQALYDAINAQRDILFIAAAGNDGCDTDKIPFYPADYYLPNVISVAATDNSDARALWSLQPNSCDKGSNYGRRSTHLAAPGYNIYSSVPGGYSTKSGTSMAAPHVTGLAALIKSYDMIRDWRETKNLILSGGDAIASMDGITITGRRINAYGSLTCSNSPVFSILTYPSSLQVGLPTTLSALSINCGQPVGPVTVLGSNGQTIPLHDDGILPDMAAGDGIFSGTWVPSETSGLVLFFSSSAGSEAISVPPLTIETFINSPASMSDSLTSSAQYGISYSQVFSAIGGVSPVEWTIVSGALPSGLLLNSATGEVSGAPSAVGPFSFRVKGTDSIGQEGFMSFTILVNKEIRTGWPKELKKRISDGSVSYSPIFADMDRDGKDEIIVVDESILYVFASDGLSKKITLPARVTSPVIADLDNDGDMEIIVSVGWPSLNPPIYVFHHDLTPVEGFPAGAFPTYNNSAGWTRPPVVADLDGDGNTEVLVVCNPNNLNDPNSGKGVIVVVDSQGQMLTGWPKIVDHSFASDSLAVGDIDNDGSKEMVFASDDGILHIYRMNGDEIYQWAFAQGNVGRYWRPILADIDGDGYLDIVMKYSNSGSPFNINVYDRTGTSLPGWPKTFTGIPLNRLVVADINEDGRPEIISSGNNWWEVNVLRYDGTTLPGWPFVFSAEYQSIDCDPVVGDVNGDGKMEILINTVTNSNNNGKLYAISSNAVLVSEYPKFTTPGSELRTTPALGDFDNNGKVDIVVKSEDGMLYVWEAGQVSAVLNFEWPMSGRDFTNSNLWSKTLSVLTSSLPYGSTGIGYSRTLHGAGGLLPYIWSISSGSLPSGLSLNSFTGKISGTPTVEGIFTFTAQVKDRSSVVETKAFSISIGTVEDITPPITTASPVGGTYLSAQSVSLGCNDGGVSGCANTYYCIGAGCNPKTQYTGGTIDISSSIDLRFYSTDNAWNSEDIKTESYTIVLTLTANAEGNGSGTVSSDVGGISYSYPTANTGTSTPLNHNAIVTLTANTGTCDTVSWSGNCGSTSGNGTTTATCTVTIDNTKTATAKFINALMPVAAFAGAPLSGTSPLTVNFTDQSSCATSWSWNFGDGTTSTSQNPTHTYNPSWGSSFSVSYPVSLTATNANGSNTLAKTSYITARCPNQPVKNTRTGISYNTLQAAHDAAIAGDTIISHAIALTENLTISKAIAFSGGYNCDYTSQTGKTSVTGNLTIGTGDFTINMDNFDLQ